MSTSEKIKHTPGPWFAGTGWIGAGDVKDGKVICSIDHFPYGATEANANLIAAAPEMLQVLERVFDWCNTNHQPVIALDVDAIVRKAKGE